MVKFIIIILLACGHLVTSAQANTSEFPDWEKPTPIFSQEFDWLKLVSDEWLKGDIISMYDDELEFDSDEFGIKFFDWEDVSELRSRFDQQIRLSDGRIVQGFLIVKGGHLTLISDGTEQYFPLSELLSITSAADTRKDLWDGKVSLGIDYSQGNSGQLDYIFAADLQRRTPTTRLKADFVFNYSETSNEETSQVSVNTRRFNAYFDWFINADIFYRVIEYENYSDIQQNIKVRNSLGTSLGYHFVNTKRIEWDFNLGPSYQSTEYESSVATDSGNGLALSIGTLLEYEISSKIDYVLDYQMSFISEESGARSHHFETGFEFEFIEDFDIDVVLYIDRIAKPVTTTDNKTPEPNDYRLAVSLGYQF